MYLASRDWLVPLDMIVRAGFAKTLERQAEKLARHEVQSSSKEEARRRARNRTELKRHDRRVRKQFGWRGAADARMPRLSLNAEFDFDPGEAAKREAEMLFAEQAAGETNNGISAGVLPADPYLEAAVREYEQKSMTAEDRQNEALTDLLSGEVSKFMRKKNGTTD